MRSRLWTIGSFVVALLLTPCREGFAQVYEGKELVKAELIADTLTIVPGKPFRAGLLLHLAPHWHTYWKYSGDAGLPIELKWHLPAGWKAGELRWPVPLKFDDPGDIQTYGYQDEVLLIQELTPPASISDQSVRLTADANWLVCEKICIPGSATLQLNLTVGQSPIPTRGDLFARYEKLQPSSQPDLSVQWSRAERGLVLKAKSHAFANSSVVDFYPLPRGNVVVSHSALQNHTGEEATFLVPIESGFEGLSSLPGLLVYGNQNDGRDRAGLIVADGPTLTPGDSVSVPDRRGLLAYLFLGFVGGLILNLMPCVLPVISLKLFGFLQQAGQSRRKIFESGLFFAAGIFAWFVGLAMVLIALRRAGHQITWALQFTNPYFVLGMSAVVLVFALNLFGVFEISLPQSLNRGLLGVGATEGHAASFFQGVFATVLATPCTAPFLGTALGFAFTQPALVIFAIFLAIAAGMSLPYVILCAQPAWIRLLPKPGPWMVHVKQLMGFLLLATLIFLLYVLGAQRGLEALTWASAFLLVVAIACWMKGVFFTPSASLGSRIWAGAIMILLLILGGSYFVGSKFAGSSVAAVEAPGGEWQSFTPEKLQKELDQDHAVFVDFTAAWCITCKFNEASVLESADVRKALREHSVTKMRADWTNGDPVITKLLKHFGRPGVPLYVLYPGKNADPIVFPELLTKGMVLDKLESLSHRIATQ